MKRLKKMKRGRKGRRGRKDICGCGSRNARQDDHAVKETLIKIKKRQNASNNEGPERESHKTP